MDFHSRFRVVATAATAAFLVQGAFSQDECTTAVPITDGMTAFDTTLASDEGLPVACGSGAALDIWYAYTPAAAGPLTVSTCNAASFDARLEVYESCGGTLLGGNDDGPGCSGFTSELTVNIAAGSDMFIRVKGWNGATGTGTLTVDGPVFPDECADAALVTTDLPFAFDTTNATETGFDFSCNPFGGDLRSRDIWLTFTATADYMASASTCNTASHDTKIEIYDGTCGALNSIICEEDTAGCAGFTTTANFMAFNGTQYFIRIGGWQTSEFGPGEILVTGLDSYVNFPATAGTAYLFHVGGFGTAEGLGIMTVTEGLGSIVCLGDPNSTGVGADLAITGSDVVADNNLILTVTNLPANAMGYFVHSLETNTVLNPGGSEGTLCIASFSMGRFNANVLNSGAGGTVTFTPDLTALPTVMGPVAAAPGETRFFQYWTRDMSAAGSATSNFSGATGVVLQ